MELLPQAEGYRIKPLVTSTNELSVQSVLDGCMPGTIWVNDRQHPTAALIRTSECNLVAGTPDDAFMAALTPELDFWDTLTPDSQAWFEKIPAFHPNPYVRPFPRRRYELVPDAFRPWERALPEGYLLERADPAQLRNAPFRNADDVLEWAGAWGDDALFDERGAGRLIRNSDAIVGWSLSDCYDGDKVAIGVRTDGRFRRMGFGIRVASETVKQCFAKGYRSVDWLCVQTNQGSIAIAEKLGFRRAGEYSFFCSFLPTENPLDIPAPEWEAWGRYLENASEKESGLLHECAFAYIRANNVEKTMDILRGLDRRGDVDWQRYTGAIAYFQSLGMCSAFSGDAWLAFAGGKES